MTPHRRTLSAAGGFTLLELVVVLALIGLLTAVVVPRLYNSLISVTTRTQLEILVAQLDVLAVRAFALGVPISLDEKSAATRLPDGEPLLAVPDGWKIVAPRPIHFELSGFCEGGTISITPPDGLSYNVRLAAPDCRAVLEDARPG